MEFDNRVLQEYMDRLQSGHEEDRVEIYLEMRALSFPWDDELLLLALSDPSPRVRSVVCDTLSENSDSRVIASLLEFLRDQDPGIRSLSMSILSRLGAMALPQVESI